MKLLARPAEQVKPPVTVLMRPRISCSSAKAAARKRVKSPPLLLLLLLLLLFEWRPGLPPPSPAAAAAAAPSSSRTRRAAATDRSKYTSSSVEALKAGSYSRITSRICTATASYLRGVRVSGQGRCGAVCVRCARGVEAVRLPGEVGRHKH